MLLHLPFYIDILFCSVVQSCINMSSYRVKHRKQWMKFPKTVSYSFKFT